jgi:hypothetical protein
MTLMSQSDFAAHIGVNRSHITQLKNAGRLVMQDGKVDVEASIKRIDDTKDPAKEGVAKRHQQERSQKEQEKTEKAPIASGSGSRFQSAKARREEANAELTEIDLQTKRGQLLIADEVKLAVADGDTVIRNRLESLPDILAPQLSAETDEQKIRSMLMDHIESLLGDLSRSFYTLAK